MLTKQTIYVAEDNVDLREYAEVVLTKAGYDVKAFEDGKLTLEALLNTTAPALLLTDINMPNMTGTELIKQVRQTERFKDMHIVVYSTEEEVKDYEEDKVLNTISLHKPAKADTLLALIGKLIASHKNY
ncbi:rec [Caudoviricetes sp.]|nr:rec [Caudoviricetes sp.]UOF79101.1 rec [Caudoviricetes sp.]